jgi:hypothetical protein
MDLLQRYGALSKYYCEVVWVSLTKLAGTATLNQLKPTADFGPITDTWSLRLRPIKRDECKNRLWVV